MFVIMILSVFSVQAAAKTGWVRQGSIYKYKLGKSYVKNKVQKIGKNYYYFDKKGIRKTGWIKFKRGKYYFDKKKAYAYTGKLTIDGKLYLFTNKGQLVVNKGIYKYGKGQVYINADGSLATGIVKVKNKWYFYEKSGFLASGSGVRQWNNKTYYVKNGQFVSGWIKVGSVRKHFNASNYILDTGRVKIGNNYYLLDENGVPMSGLRTISGVKYYCDSNGECKTGFISIGRCMYYFTNDGAMVTERYFTTSGYTYYADEDGRIKTNCWYDGKYFNHQGQVVKDAVIYDSTTTGEVTKETLDDLSLSGCTKLMIVAHPDDETLWGGGHLTEGGWFVVCLTNGYNQVRKNEFYTVVHESGNIGLILSYPDLQGGKKSDWSLVKPKIAKDLDTLMNYKHWGMVVTHNPAGGYGHIHHRMTSALVTQSFYRNYWGINLYYFGKYYNKTDLQNISISLKKLPIASSNKKRELLSLYTSQKGAVNDSIHMCDYENFIRADQW